MRNWKWPPESAAAESRWRTARRLQINRRALVGKSENLAAICLWERVWGRACGSSSSRLYNACVRGGGAEWNEPVAARCRQHTRRRHYECKSSYIYANRDTNTFVLPQPRSPRSLGSLARSLTHRMKYICISIKIAKNDARQRAYRKYVYVCALMTSEIPWRRARSVRSAHRNRRSTHFSANQAWKIAHTHMALGPRSNAF